MVMAVKDGEDAPKSVGEDYRNHVRHSWTALANRSSEGDVCDHDECSMLLNEHRRSLRDLWSLEEKTGDELKSDSVELISNVFGLEVEARVARGLGLGGLGVSIRVLSIPPDQLAEVPKKAFSVLVFGSRNMPRLVECAAAAAEGEDHGHSKPNGPLIGLPPKDAAAEGGG